MSIVKQLQDAEKLFMSFVDEIDRNKISDVSIRRALKKYDVKNLKINNVTPLRAKKIYSSILLKYENGVPSDKSWLQNERRLFIWSVVCYLYREGLEVPQLKTSDIEWLNSLFPFKDIDLIKFQINSLIKKGNKNSTWCEKEDQILTKIVMATEGTDLQWSNISKEFFVASQETFFRNAKQCRERWLNHLDPTKTKGHWQPAQDIILLKEVLHRGKKWSKISVALDGKKNEHMVKNRYKSLTHKKEKALRNKRIKQNDLIRMILDDLTGNKVAGNEKIEEIDQGIGKKQQNDECFQSSEDQPEISDQQQIYKENQSMQEQKVKPKQQVMEQQEQNEKNEQKIKQEQVDARCTSNFPIIVEPNNKKVVVQEAPVIPSPMGFRNIEEQLQPDQQNEVEIYGNKNDADMYDRLFQSASTPNVATDTNNNSSNRYSSIYLDSRSPASLFMSPYIYFLQGPQGQVSPQVGFGSFYTKFTNDFHKFVQQEQEKPSK